jgi:ribonuclease HII
MSTQTLIQHYGTTEEDINKTQIGIDEVGRGPLFGRVYVAAVILPKNDPQFQYHLLKDSKRFHSTKKIKIVSDYIKSNSICWSVQYESEDTIDKINILQATQQAMHKCIRDMLSKLKEIDTNNVLLLVDGNYFNTLNIYNTERSRFETISHICIEGGDNKYCSIAAASILAKVARDEYIKELCVNHPELVEKYHIDKNKGYGSQKHLEGIKEYGITSWHRKSFGICKRY